MIRHARAAVLTSFTCLAIMTTQAHAQFVTGNIGYGNGFGYSSPYVSGNYNSGYGINADNAAVNVMNGTAGPVQAAQSAYQSNRDIYSGKSSDSSDSSGSSSSSKSKITPGWSFLDDDSDKAKTATDSSDSKKTDATSDDSASLKNSSGNDMTALQKKTQAMLDRAAGKKPEEDVKAVAKKPAAAQVASTAFTGNVSGYAQALDGLTLRVGSRTVTLDGLKAPGNTQSCYKQGMPWNCGEQARNSLQEIVEGQVVTCGVVNDRAACMTDTGGNVIQDVLKSGYALPDRKNATRYSAFVSEAKMYKRGLFQE